MFGNYLKFTWRTLTSSKLYSFINIAGLATGMAVTLLIGLWIKDELSFNHYFSNHKRIAQVMVTQIFQDEYSTNESVSVLAGRALENYKSDFKRVSFVSWSGDRLISFDEKKLAASSITVGESFPAMFDLKITSGSRDVLHDPTTILISQTLATAMFGNGNATGKVIRLDNNEDLTIGGVFEDMPHNTVFYGAKILIPWTISGNFANNNLKWDNHSPNLYVELADNANFGQANAKIKNLPTPHIDRWHEELTLQPLDKQHLYSEYAKGKAVSGRIRFVWMFALIGAFVLLVACINFMNLSTARSEKRAREVGIRKSVGAMRIQVIRQFLNESVIVAMLSFSFAIVLVSMALPYFNQLADKQIVIEWRNPVLWLIGIGFTVLTGIIAGSYPAFYLSAFNPVKVLKGTFHAGRAALVPRRVLVVVQFTVSIALIIGTIIVFRQIEFARSRPVGYTREGLISVGITGKTQEHFSALRNELILSGAVSNIAASSQQPTHFNNNNSIDWPGKDPAFVSFFRDVNVTHEFGRTIGWHVLQGRDFSGDRPADSSAAIINETAARIMNIGDPVGKAITYGERSFTIIGIVNDLVTQSPYEPMEPSVFFGSGWLSTITIRLNERMRVSEALKVISTVFKKYDPEAPFNYNFVDQVYARKFENERKIGNLAGFFAVFAIFISCLGLFGLSSYVAEQRTKEIGVRKVLGASVINVWKLLSKEFVILTMISFVIAIPVAYYFMSGWLQNYQYRSEMSWWIFAVTAAGSLLITLLTISFQAIKAALANPVKSLRSE